MRIKVVKFKTAVAMPGTGTANTELVREGDRGSLAFDEKLSAVVITNGGEQTIVPWQNVAYVKILVQESKK